jgi:uncharacterized DUF497 family protein
VTRKEERKAARKGPTSNKLAPVAAAAARVPRPPRKLKFDLDQNNRPMCEARLPIAEIEALFKRRDTAFADDPKMTEKRYRTMGVNSKGEPIFVVFTIRRAYGQWLIRPISARYARAEEVRKWPPPRN